MHALYRTHYYLASLYGVDDDAAGLRAMVQTNLRELRLTPLLAACMSDEECAKEARQERRDEAANFCIKQAW